MRFTIPDDRSKIGCCSFLEYSKSEGGMKEHGAPGVCTITGGGALCREHMLYAIEMEKNKEYFFGKTPVYDEDRFIEKA